MNFPLPIIRGRIARRILVNFRADPHIVAGLLPDPFRPALVNGFAMAGICLIRLEQMRPQGISGALGLSSENAAHRIAVEWDDGNETKHGVYIPRRDTDSLLNQLAGGRIFPGVHHAADFRVFECPTRIKLDMFSRDLTTQIRVAARIKKELPADSVFGTMAQASTFFQSGSLGWSPGSKAAALDGIELHTLDWQVEPLAVEHLISSYFDDIGLFPKGSIHFDCALLMRNIEHEWIARGRMFQPESTFCAC